MVEERDKKDIQRFEYAQAQDMLKHYDALNWQVGSILIAGLAALTGFVVNQQAEVDLLKQCIVIYGVPFFSLVLLCFWGLWYQRHRFMYNLRNEVLHRLELELGMYHFLKVVDVCENYEGDEKTKQYKKSILEYAKTRAGYGNKDGEFKPFYVKDIKKAPRPSGYHLMWIFVIIIPLLQHVLFLFLFSNLQNFSFIWIDFQISLIILLFVLFFLEIAQVKRRT